MKQVQSALAISLLSLSFASCAKHNSSHADESVIVVPTFFEVEPNDDAFNANDMGLLLVGDFFYIEGSISDTGFDPFDGFLFTAGEPIHVDFRLFIDNQLADFDVCLYDPLFDEILACYETSSNPELGGVDVFSSFEDFHLVVNSFIGSGTYALEIDVQPLFLREGESSQAAGSNAAIVPRFPNTVAPAQAFLGIRNRLGAEGFSDYGMGSQSEQSVEIRSLESDVETGVLVESVEIQALD